MALIRLLILAIAMAASGLAQYTILELEPTTTPAVPEIHFWDLDRSHQSGFKPSDVTTTSYNFILPAALPGSTLCISSTTGGQLGYAACSGGGSLPVVDTTSIVEGSADATKEVRLEVDGLTTSTVRVWTAPDADITVAGIDLAQTWTAAQVLGVTTTTTAMIPGANLTYDYGADGNMIDEVFVGDIRMPNTGRIWAKDSGGTYRQVAYFDSGNTLTLGGSTTVPSGGDLRLEAPGASGTEVAVLLNWLSSATGTFAPAVGQVAIGSGANPWDNGYIQDTLFISDSDGAGGIVPGVRIEADAGAGPYTEIRSGASTPWNLTLPTTGGTVDYVLRTDGSGTTSWVAQSGGGSITVEDEDGVPSYTGITKISFDQTDGFAITNPFAGEAQIDMPNVVFTDNTQSITGQKTFEAVAQFDTDLEIRYSVTNAVTGEFLGTATNQLDLRNSTGGLMQRWNATSNFTSINMGMTTEQMVPDGNGTRSIGTDALEYLDLWLEGTAHIDILDVDFTSTFASAATFNGGLVAGTGTNSTLHIGTGALYVVDRNLASSSISCSGVDDSYLEVTTDDYIVFCEGGSRFRIAGVSY